MAEEIFERPSQDALQTELNRLKHKKRFRILLRSTLYTCTYGGNTRIAVYCDRKNQ